MPPSTFIWIVYSSLHVSLLLPWAAVAWVVRIDPVPGRQRLSHQRDNNSIEFRHRNYDNNNNNCHHQRFPHICPSSTTSLFFSSNNNNNNNINHVNGEEGTSDELNFELVKEDSTVEDVPEISHLAALGQQLKQIQRQGLERTSTSKSTPYDKAMAEWEDSERRINQEDEEEEDLSYYISPDDNSLPYARDSRGPLPSIIEEAREKRWEEKAVLDTLYSSRTLPPSFSTFDEVNLPPGAIPSHYAKKYISDFEITPDGGVQLSPEAYRQACQNAANPDGSLNLRSKNNPQNEAPTIFSPSVLEAVTAKPMAPYGRQQSDAKEITIEELIKQARQARQRLEQNPQAQEELHRRIMAEEEEATVATNIDASNLFQEALLDPQKAFEFWNQEYLETKKAEIEALGQLLDEKMKLFAEMNQQTTSLEENHSNSGMDVSSSSMKQAQDTNRNRLEQDRLQRARNITRFNNNGDDDWYGDSEKEANIPNMDENGAIKGQVLEPAREGNIVGRKEKGTWLLVEDPTTSDDPFYWNSGTNEMRRYLPTEDIE